jgi:hypothetical protein
LMFAGGAAAEAQEGISTTVSGYGTVGGTVTSDSSYAYRHDSSEFTGASNQFDVGLETRFGVQAVVDFGTGFSVTAQELARARGNDDFVLGTEWLYFQYVPTSGLKLRLGRVALATFLTSDSREVGYAQPWFRSPNEVYGQEPFFFLDGGEVLWNHNLGQAVLTLQSGYGTSKQTLELATGELAVNATNVVNASVQIQYGSFLARVAQTNLHNPITLPLSATYSLTYGVVDKFTSVGLQYDDGKAIAMGEWAKRTQNVGPGLPLPLAASKQWYVAGGWRFGKLTPLLTYGTYQSQSSLVSPAGTFGTWSGSLRYDVVQNIALKAQVSRPQAGNSAYWIAPNFASNERVNVYSVGADFVF